MIDPTNRVVALCAEGMMLEGVPADAMRLFEEAWAVRSDDFEAAIAAHYVARRAAMHLDQLPTGGYRELVAMGIRRLAERLGVEVDVGPVD